MKNILFALALTMCSPAFAIVEADVSFLYGQAIMDNLEYITSVNGNSINNNVTNSAKIHDLDFEWNPGVRASIGYSPCFSNICFLATGTYYQSSAKAHHKSDIVFNSNTTIDFAASLWNQAFMGTASAFSSAHWKLKFGLLDLLAKTTFPTDCGVIFQPNLGLRGVWIDQNYSLVFRDSVFGTSDNNVFIPVALSTTHPHSTFKGVGIKMGTDLQIPILCQVNLLGSLGGSLVYGESRMKETFFTSQVNHNQPQNQPGTLNVTVNDRKNRIRYDVESELGLSYCQTWRNFTFNIAASYFFAIWFDQNAFENITFTTSSFLTGTNSSAFLNVDKKLGNLQLQGLAIKGEVLF